MQFLCRLVKKRFTNYFIQMTKTNDWRYERKYLVESLDHRIWLERIKALGFLEAYPQRKIHNLYFDTPDFNFFYQAVNGHFNRKKIRLRWYNDDISDCQLEVKIKQGELGRKDIYPISFDQVIDPALLRQKLTHVSELQHLLPLLTASLENSYLRSYFVHPIFDIRLTIDTNLKFENDDQNNLLIIELKYNDQPKTHHQASQIIQHLPIHLSQMSKYTMGLGRLMLNN